MARERARDHQDAFLFSEIFKGFVEQFGWHFYIGWRCLYGRWLCRRGRWRGPPGLSPPRCRFGCGGGGFRSQLRRGPNQLLRFFRDLIEGTRADFVLEFPERLLARLLGVADIPEYRHRPAQLYRRPLARDSRGPSMAHLRSHNQPMEITNLGSGI